MITPRLQSIIDMVTSDSIADIGTDHAYIPIRLAKDKKIKKAIACDKNKGPIDIANDNIKKYGLSNIIITRQGDGLEPILKNEVSEIIIAGMGGNLIGNIIEADLEKAQNAKLILQPMNAQAELRKRLHELGFTIIKEELSCEGFKVYNLMYVIFKRDINIYKEIDYHFPKSLLSHPLCDKLFNKKKREFEKIIKGQKESKNPDLEMIEKYSYLLDELLKINKKGI